MMLQVSPNGRYFIRNGAPFFWMGDTVWSLVNRYTPEEAEEGLAILDEALNVADTFTS